jgi:hypothetical protein
LLNRVGVRVLLKKGKEEGLLYNPYEREIK